MASKKRRQSFDGEVTSDVVWGKILQYELKLKKLTKDEHATLLLKDWETAQVMIPHCIESSYKPSGGRGSTRGVPVMSYLARNYRPHRVACHIGPLCDNFPYFDGAEASHLCHNSLCFNPLHIVFEPSKINRSRYCCEIFGEKEMYRCPHDPVCINCQSMYDVE